MSDQQLESGNLTPNSAEAEEAVLGALLVNPDAYHEVASIIRTGDFYQLRHNWIWDAIQRLAERDEGIEFLTVMEELRAHNQLDNIGGASYLNYLVNTHVISTNAATYAQLVARTALRRGLISAAENIAQIAKDGELDVNQVMDKSEAEIFAVTDAQLKKETVPISHAMTGYFDQIEYLYENQENLDTVGVPSGFVDMDKLLGGFQKSDLLILAARPGMGKTSLMLNVAINAASRGAKVGVFSLEMSNDQLIQRLISTHTGINSQSLRLGRMNSEQWQRFIAATKTVGNYPIFLDDTPALSVLQLRTKCRRLYREHKIELILVDYLQLMTSGVSIRGDNRVQEISYISRGLKELARELSIPIIAGAQLSRAVEQRMDKRPLLSDLRESGSIEQDADVVMFIYRDDVYTQEESERPNEADIIIAKHRNGPTGTVTLFFKKELTTFTDMKHITGSTEDF